MTERYLNSLAIISERHGVLGHAATPMLTHEHPVVTDARGCLSHFFTELRRAKSSRQSKTTEVRIWLMGSRMRIRDEIAAAAALLGVDAIESEGDAAQALERSAEIAFAKPGSNPLWERLLKCENVHDEEAWRSIGVFVVEPATLFVRDAQGFCAFRFGCGTDLVATIDRCPGFELYVFDDLNRFLLSFNDHDVLIGCGTAVEWIRGLRANKK